MTCKTGSDDVYTAAAMAVKGVLAAHEKKQLLWSSPGICRSIRMCPAKIWGVYYSNFFSSSKEIASYASAGKRTGCIRK